jgi:sugar phosphate isomerase/epimerase
VAYPWSILCSTGAFAPAGSDWRRILQYGSLLDAEGLELLVQPGWSDQRSTIVPALASSGLRFPVLHAEKSLSRGLGQPAAAARGRALQCLEANCDFAARLGAHLVVLHPWELPESDDHIALNLDALFYCLRISDQYGLELAIETIPCRQADPLQHIHHALEIYPTCRVTLDTEFLAVHRQVEAALTAPWLWQQDSVRHIHIKDYAGPPQAKTPGRRFLHPGEGLLDFGLIFARLHEQQFAGSISLEAAAWAPDGTVDVPRLRQSLELLRHYRTWQTSAPQAEETPPGRTD